MASPLLNDVPVRTVPPSGDDRIDALVDGSAWGTAPGQGVQLDFSFPSPGAAHDGSVRGYQPSADAPEIEWDSLMPLSGPERAAVERALEAWAKVSGLTFASVPDTNATAGDIRVAKSMLVEVEGALAWAYLPSAYPIGGDAWLNPLEFAGAGVLQGSYNYATLLHEMGHALGLQHPHQDGGGGFPWDPVTLPEDLETMMRTVMAYEYGYSFDFQPTTPMLYDVSAIQHLYGPNMGHLAGDTTYDFFEGERYFRTLWDGGGTDLIRYSGTDGVLIDLREGAASHLGREITGFRFDDDSYLGEFSDPRTVWIAYGAEIENAAGGSGDDEIRGNGLRNQLSGRGGDDTLRAGGGRDTLLGASGRDTLDGGSGIDKLDGGPGADDLRGGSAGDRLDAGGGRDELRGNGGNDQLSGSAGADRLLGGTGADTLAGNAGADYLDGGNGADLLAGGGGGDMFVFASAPGPGNIDVLSDFTPGFDRIVLDPAAFPGLAGLPGGALDPAGFALDAAATADHHIIYEVTSGLLFYDPDGNTTAGDELPFAVSATMLTADDIYLVA